jgi:hypothetical protein
MDLALPGQMVWSSLTETLDDVCHMIKHWSDVCGPR